MVFGGHWILRGHRMQRDSPCIFAGVVLRQRHLLLPRRDPDHHLVVRHPIGFYIEVIFVPANFCNFSERRKAVSNCRCIISRGGGLAALPGEHIFRQCIHRYDLKLAGFDPETISRNQAVNFHMPHPAIFSTNMSLAFSDGDKRSGDCGPRIEHSPYPHVVMWQYVKVIIRAVMRKRRCL